VLQIVSALRYDRRMAAAEKIEQTIDHEVSALQKLRL
jgi:hypothetical protein